MAITNLSELVALLNDDPTALNTGTRQDGTSTSTLRINPIAQNLGGSALSTAATTVSTTTPVSPTSTATRVVEQGETIVYITGPKGDIGPQGPAGASGFIGADGVGVSALAIDLSGNLIVTLDNDTTINAGSVNSAITIGSVTTDTTASASISGTAPNQILDLVFLNAQGLGLGNVTNESKATMFTSPAFTGTPTAPTAITGTNTTQIATTEFVRTAVSDLVNAAPEQLDTLSELANALADDSAFATTVTDLIATKAPIDSPTFTGTVSGITSTMIGLGNVTNESKATMFTDPVFTGTTTAPTPTTGDSSTKIATTAFITTYVQTAGRNSQGTKTISSSAPSGGVDGDIWYQV